MSSNQKLRKESNCLNCGNEVTGKYCSACGQLNREPKMGISDLFHDIVHSTLHFDGKFFNTAKYLITKPGFLTSEYVNGKRAKYLPPVQIYLFTSAVFFFILYTIFLHTPDSENILDKNEIQAVKEPIKLEIIDSLVKISSVEEYHKKQSVLPQNQQDGFIRKYMTLSLPKS